MLAVFACEYHDGMIESDSPVDPTATAPRLGDRPSSGIRDIMPNARSRTRIAGLATLLVVVLTATNSFGDTYSRQKGVDAIHYSFRLTLGDETDEITGEAAVELRFVEEGITGFALDLVSAKSGTGMGVSAVTSQSAHVPFEHKDDRLRVTLDPPPKAGERRTFTVTYRGEPRAGLRIGKNRHGERTFTSENWPDKAHDWLPMIDHPVRQGDQ